MSFPRSGVEDPGDPVTLPLGQRVEVCALPEILPDQPIGVLVGAALPRVMRIGEIKHHPAARLDLLVAMEFAAVVRGDRPELSGMSRQQHAPARYGLFDGPRLQLAIST
jgi:hypothetical protein